MVIWWKILATLRQGDSEKAFRRVLAKMAA